MFYRQRAPGLWTFDSVVTGDEFEYIDASLPNAIDGSQGGAYSLQHDLSIGGVPGADLGLDLPVTVTDLFTATADVILGSTAIDTLSVEATATFLADVTINGDRLDVYGISYFHEEAQFQWKAFFYEDAFFNGNLYIANTGSLGVLGPTSFSAPVSLGTGGYIKSRVFWQTDSDVTKGPKDCDEVIVQAGALTANRTFTIDDTGAQDDAKLVFSSQNATYYIQVRAPGGALLATVWTGTPNLGNYEWVELHRKSGVWTVGRFLLTS